LFLGMIVASGSFWVITHRSTAKSAVFKEII
jgi:hypothetical protein